MSNIVAASETIRLIRERLKQGMRTYIHDMYTSYFNRLYGPKYGEDGGVVDVAIRTNFILDTDSNGVVYVKGVRNEQFIGAGW